MASPRFLMFITMVMLACGTVASAANGAGPSELEKYLRKPEAAFRWEKQGEQKIDGCTVYDLHFVSQVWQGITWEHHLQVFRPEHLVHPEFCALYNTGGSGSPANTLLGATMAKDTGCNYAILYDIPNQPLFGGKKEDALVVHTWLKYMETGDPSWPLHFPMAKAVWKAMDVIQQAAEKANFQPITGFLIHGASKRGWTTWLSAAGGDPRIKAIAPMVIDTLNLPKQGPHQLEMYGKFSEQIEDYTRVNMNERLQTPEGKRLIALEDPYSYRDKLTLPKLLIFGTNDRYWSQDALNLYWDDLKGPKWILYTPNSGHGLEDKGRVLATLAAFIRATAAGKQLPQVKWDYTTKGKDVHLHVASSPEATEARLFHVHAPTTDFRDQHWTFDPMPHTARSFEATHAAPTAGNDAIFGEAVFQSDGKPYTLSTQMRILKSGK